jgi:hypothetical protein
LSEVQTIVRALDQEGDWTFGTGKGNYLSGNAAMAQQIRSNILQFFNNAFWSMNTGIDWFNLLGSRNNEILLQLAISAAIINTQGVTGQLQLEISLPSNRAFSIQYSVETVFSTVKDSIFHEMAA